MQGLKLHVARAGDGDWVRARGNEGRGGHGLGAPGGEMAVAVRPQLVNRKGHSQISFTKVCLTQQKSRQRYRLDT